MTVLIYTLLVWFRRTRSAFIFSGFVIAFLGYLVLGQLNLDLTTEVLERFFVVIPIALVVIFQEELRGFFERIAVFSFEKRVSGRPSLAVAREEVDVVARAAQAMARKNVGALIVFKGRDLIDRHLEGGTPLRGLLSEQLLMSLFDPNSIGHDGAAVIVGDELNEFGCMLPLSKNLSKIRGAGTRHAAALGLSEVCDALCLVVSEERGTISVARNGEIDVVRDPNRLIFILERFYRETAPKSRERFPWYRQFWLKHWRQKALALAMSVGLWGALVYRPVPTTRDIWVPVEVPGTPKTWTVVVEPSEVRLTVSAPVWAFFIENQLSSRLRVQIDPDYRFESNEVLLSSGRNILLPQAFELERVEPSTVWVTLSDGDEE